MSWRRADPGLGDEVWHMNDVPIPEGSLSPPLWTVYRVLGRRTHRVPSGEFWRGMRDGVVLRANQRVRSWLSRHAAMSALEELARLGL